MKHVTRATGLAKIAESREYFLHVRKQDDPHPLGIKHLLRVWDKHKKVGFASFYVADDGSHFEGMRVAPDYRGRGFSHLLLETMLQFVDAIGVPVAETGVQTKPDICFVLAGYGFIPYKGSYFAAFMLPKNGAEGFRLYIPDLGNRHRFESSQVFKDGSYTLVDRLEEPATRIHVGAIHHLNGTDAYFQRRSKNNELLRVDLQRV